jgi:acid phosphatase type 7
LEVAVNVIETLLVNKVQLDSITRRDFLRAAGAATVAGSFLAGRLAADEGSAFLRYPNVQNVSASGAAICWTMPALVEGSVVVSDQSGSSQTVAASVLEFEPSQTGMPATYYQYQAAVGGLNPGTMYSYSVQTLGQSLTRSHFTTPGSEPFHFLHFADSGEGNGAQFELGAQMQRENAALVLANGDLAYDLATFASIEANYYGVYRQMMSHIPFFGSMGNHEYLTGNGVPTLSSRVTPVNGVPAADAGRYYSFDWGNVHFVVLDSNAPLVNSIAGTDQMLTWLASDLSSTRQFWRVVMYHHPGYATGVHQDEPPAGQVRQYIVPILEQYGVQLVFNGHEHTYQRTFELLAGNVVAPNSGGIVYITSGGGGAGPYWTAPNDLIAESIGVNNYVRGEVSQGTVALHTFGLGRHDEIDSIVLAPAPQISSVVNSASYTSDLASGGAVIVFGRNLSCVTVQSCLTSPMMEAGGCSVSFNGTPIPILYADAGQINLQIPFSLSGSGALTVLTPNGVTQTNVNISPVAPQLVVDSEGLPKAMHAPRALEK